MLALFCELIIVAWCAYRITYVLQDSTINDEDTNYCKLWLIGLQRLTSNAQFPNSDRS